MPPLPARPSREHLRKQAKRLAKHQAIALSEAQGLIAARYDFRTWSDLIAHVARVRGEASTGGSPLFAAVKAGNLTRVRELLDQGANPRQTDGRETPLHAAVRLGSLTIVEALITGGALEWQLDDEGRSPLDVARRSRGKERASIIALLDRRAIADPAFRAAVDALHAGDTLLLALLLDRNPRLLHARLVGSDVYRRRERYDYFQDPKLFWFVANNPRLVDTMPANMDEVAALMIARGVEPDDLDYTLMLTMTSASARNSGLTLPLMRVLVSAGATFTRETILAAGVYRECDALRGALELGYAKTTAIAASLGDTVFLSNHLVNEGQPAIDDAFALAVMNGQLDAARIALDAGAHINAFFPVHTHMTALHAAADDDNVPMIELLVQHGADANIRDKLFDGTPHDWAVHLERRAAQQALS